MTTEGEGTTPATEVQIHPSNEFDDPSLIVMKSHVFIVGESSEERARRERKRQLRALNARAWDGETG
jgi:hypothetical protein